MIKLRKEMPKPHERPKMYELEQVRQEIAPIYDRLKQQKQTNIKTFAAIGVLAGVGTVISGFQYVIPTSLAIASIGATMFLKHLFAKQKYGALIEQRGQLAQSSERFKQVELDAIKHREAMLNGGDLGPNFAMRKVFYEMPLSQIKQLQDPQLQQRILRTQTEYFIGCVCAKPKGERAFEFERFHFEATDDLEKTLEQRNKALKLRHQHFGADVASQELLAGNALINIQNCQIVESNYGRSLLGPLSKEYDELKDQEEFASLTLASIDAGLSAKSFKSSEIQQTQRCEKGRKVLAAKLTP